MTFTIQMRQGFSRNRSLIEVSQSLKPVERSQTRLELQPISAVTPQVQTDFQFGLLVLSVTQITFMLNDYTLLIT